MSAHPQAAPHQPNSWTDADSLGVEGCHPPLWVSRVGIEPTTHGLKVRGLFFAYFSLV